MFTLVMRTLKLFDTFLSINIHQCSHNNTFVFTIHG